MRLTLRTLLAYMDDILEPADHEDLGKKIEASDFATELIHRSRDAVRRLRLGAPPVTSSASDDVLDSVDLGDANSVAEYLDNTLPPEQVADFERMCLESGTEADVHLAEVASCHHVLTMVLGEPAEVDADMKARIYRLPEKLAGGQKLRIEPEHQAPVAVPPVPEAAPAAPPIPESTTPTIQATTSATVDQAELPDYLREAVAAKRRNQRWLIAAVVLIVAGAGVLWFANPPEAEPPADLAQSGVGDFDGDIEIEGLDNLTDPALSTDASAAAEAPPFVPNDSAASEAPAFNPSADSGEATTAPPFTAIEPEASAPEADAIEPFTVEPLLGDPATTVPPPPDVATVPEETLPVELESTAEDSAAEPIEMTLEPPKLATSVAPDSLPPAPEDGTVEPAADAGQPNGESDDPLLIASVPPLPSTDGEMTDAGSVEDTPPAEPTGPQRIGSYLGNNDVLLRLDPASNEWIRVPQRTPISTGEVLLTLPKFRTHVVLSDVNTYLSGGTRLQLPQEPFDGASGESDLNVEVVYGRMLFNAGLQGKSAAVRVDDQVREFKLSGSASLAVEVERVFVPGSDYESVAAPIKATWYLTVGSVEWPTASGGTQTIEAPAMWRTVDGIDEIPEVIEEGPEWINREAVTDVELIARDDLINELVAGQPVGIRLLELTDGKGVGRKKEVRILAATASTYVGEFEPLVKALSDGDQRRAWDDHIKDLRQSVALTPDVAVRVRESFTRLRGAEAAEDLMEMVMGYNRQQIGESREEIQVGALSQLIKWLDHDSLDYRVLAIYNIQEITGRSLGFLPSAPARQRTIALRKIWDRFESNELLTP